METWQPQTLRGFAPETGGVLPEGWTVKQENPVDAGVGLITQDSEVKNGDDSSLRLENRNDKQSLTVIQDLVEIVPGQNYVLSGYLRGDNLSEPEAKDLGINIFFQQGPAEEFAAKMTNALKRLPLSGTFDWEYFEIPFRADESSERLRVAIQLRKVSGVLWIDDIKLVASP